MNFYFLGIGEKLTEIIENAFNVNIFEFCINIAATILLIIIVRFFFWNKVTGFLESKKKSIEKEYTMRDDIKNEAIEMKAQAEETLKESKAKANEILKNAENTASIESERIISDAKIEAQNILETSKEDALKEKEAILKDAKDEVVELASLMASKMIEDNIDQEKYNNNALKALGEKNE